MVLVWELNFTTQFVEVLGSFRLTVNNRDKIPKFAGMDVGLLLQQLAAPLSIEKRDLVREQLSSYINQLLLCDFHALVQLLYRVDVPEQKLKDVLKENPHEDAGNLIADLIIQRQQEKYFLRKSFPSSNNIPDEEKW